MSWTDDDDDDDGGWEQFAEESSEDEEDEAIKQLRREAEAEKNKVKKKSLAERKQEEAAAKKAKEEALNAEARELRRKQQEVRARLGPNATVAQINRAMQEEAGKEDVRQLFGGGAAVDGEGEAFSAEDGAGAGAAAVATSCDVDLLDLIGEEEHVNFGLKLSAKLQTMSEPDHIVAFVGALLKDLQPALKSSDYQAMGKVANVCQNQLYQKEKEKFKKGKKKKKERPKLNTGSKGSAKGSNFDDFMGDDGVGGYYEAADYGW